MSVYRIAKIGFLSLALSGSLALAQNPLRTQEKQVEQGTPIKTEAKSNKKKKNKKKTSSDDKSITQQNLQKTTPSSTRGSLSEADTSEATENQGSWESITSEPDSKSFRHFGISYVSWNEILEFNNAGISREFSSFFGNTLYTAFETFLNKTGHVIDGSLIFGKFTTPGVGSYTGESKSIYGLTASYRFLYRLTPTTYASVGPLVLFRTADYSEPAGTKIISGSILNSGLLAEIKLQLSPKFEIRQSLGTIAFRAKTYWSIGLGYLY